eukprot:11174504-Heterocapsa_arctica.AAC.1
MARIRNAARLGTLYHPCRRSPEGKRPESPGPNPKAPHATPGHPQTYLRPDEEDLGPELLRE